MNKEKPIIAKISDDGKQKRLTIPKMEETNEWSNGDFVILQKIDFNLIKKNFKTVGQLKKITEDLNENSN